MIKNIDNKFYYLYELSGQLTCPYCDHKLYLEYESDNECECGARFAINYQVYEIIEAEES